MRIKSLLAILLLFSSGFALAANCKAENGKMICDPTNYKPKEEIFQNDMTNGMKVKDFLGIGQTQQEIKNQKLEIRFGGEGTYVFGDYAVTGNNVLEHNNQGLKYNDYMYDADAKQVHDSSRSLKLPKGVKKEDIVYARLYWQGHQMNDIKDKYNEVKLTVAGKSNIDITADRCHGYDATTTWNKNKPLVYRRMQYACTKNITEKVKEALNDNGYLSDIKFDVKDIQTSTGKDTEGTMYIDGTPYPTDIKLGPYGGWGVIVVYDKSAASRDALIEDLQKDNIQNLSKKSARDAEKYVNTFFKPKNVTIYGDFLAIMPWNGFDPIQVNITAKGFYTPKSGDIKSKLSFLGFAGEKKISAGEFFRVKDKTGNFQLLHKSNTNKKNNGQNNFANIFDGSISLLELQENGEYKDYEPDNSDYHLGFDLDEFDIGKYLGNAQTSLDIQFGGKMIDKSADQDLISMIAISTDMYVPQMCYQYEVYRATDWLKFYDKNGKKQDENYRNANAPKELDGAVVAGENLYYRLRIMNKNNNGESETVDGTMLSVNFNDTTYVVNSIGIDNTLSVKEAVDKDKLNTIPDDSFNSDNFVYIKDNQSGAYASIGDLIKDKSLDKSKYNGKQLSTFKDNTLKLYLGQGAGTRKNGDIEPAGGEMKPGEVAYFDLNVTVNSGTGTDKFTLPTFRTGYSMVLDLGGDKTTTIKMSDAATLSLCTDKKVVTNNDVKVQTLDGLQVVNKNFTKNGDDDRLYTQVSELPFDAKLIYRPNGERFYCTQYDSETGLCTATSDPTKMEKKTIQMNGKTIEYYELKDTSATNTEKFGLPGKLYLSVIRSSDAAMTKRTYSVDDKSLYSCKSVTPDLKIPFAMGNDKYQVDHDVSKFINQNNGILDLKNIKIADAYKGVTFMLSYRPDGLATNEGGIDDTIEASSASEYYIQKKIKDTAAERGVCFDKATVNDKGQVDYVGFRFCDGKSDKTGENNSNTAMNNLNAIVNPLITQIANAKLTFGISMSDDGSFHVCGSDNFTLRPAYFEADLTKLQKFGKLVNPTKIGDITDKNTKSKDLRVGGRYSDNIDVATKLIYARSYEGNGVPNYTALLGGDIMSSRFSIRDGLTAANNKDSISDRVKENKTYLRPFASNECLAGISSQSFSPLSGHSDRLYQSVSSDSAANGGKPIAYNGVSFDEKTGKYSVTSTSISSNSKFNATTLNADKRVWDKYGISAYVDFAARKTTDTNGVVNKIDKGSYQGAYLLSQARKEPNAKEKNIAAAVYTSTLAGSKPATNKNDQYIFNYYNVGDVMLNVYDNSWTDVYANQVKNSKWNSAKCIVDSSSNKPDNKGMVGCDVGIKTKDTRDDNVNQALVLRYQPDRIELSMTSLENDSESTVNGHPFTYFNSVDIENNLKLNVLGDGSDYVSPASNHAATSQLRQLAKLKFNTVAYLADDVYKDVVATLYDGSVTTIGGVTQPVCGFASDMNVNIKFNDYCASGADPRCLKEAANTTTAPSQYRPNFGPNTFEVKAGTEYFTIDQCKASANYDTRCYKYNVKGISSDNRFEHASGANFGLPLPLTHAISFYTNAKLSNGFINANQSGILHAKQVNKDGDVTGVNLTLMARAFSNGQTPNAQVYFNFDRMQKLPSLPLLIYASDFSINGNPVLDNTTGKMQPAKFDNSFNLIAYKASEIKDSKEDMSAGIITSSKNFEEYLDTFTGADKAAQLALARASGATGTYALFVYGKSHDASNGATLYTSEAGNDVSAIMQEALYCGSDNCGSILSPQAYLAPTTGNIFSGIGTSADFVVNRQSATDVSNQTANFVSRYSSDHAKVSINRANISDGLETITISSAVRANATIGILTNPWLVYTPTDKRDKVFFVNGRSGDYANAYSSAGVPQYYNYIRVRFGSAGRWGGEGTTKGNTDDVGQFVGGNDTGASTDGANTNGGRNFRNDRMNW